MEKLLHYVWLHRLYPFGSLHTADGRTIDVINPGMHNMHAGPDFLEAQIRVGDETWVGQIEIHTLASDWNVHGHQSDEAYNNVILHVVSEDNGPVFTSSGRQVEQVVIAVPNYVQEHYEELMMRDRKPPCMDIAAHLSAFELHRWFDRLTTERLEAKTIRINELADRLGGDWEKVMFVTLARSFGFGVNGEAFEEWAMSIPLMAVGKHRDDLFQIEAIFLGQAGLLSPQMVGEAHRAEALEDEYYLKLKNEYQYLAHKFTLAPIDATRWRFLRLRPQNFPHIRLVQLATLYHGLRVSLSSLMEAQTLNEVRALFFTEVTPYWRTHYTFGAESRSSSKVLRESSVDSIIINTVVPMLFAYGRHRFHPEYVDRALAFLSSLKAEQNHITRQWTDSGLSVSSAADSQALIQLSTRYCRCKDCLHCLFGMEYIKDTKIYHALQEPKS